VGVSSCNAASESQADSLATRKSQLVSEPILKVHQVPSLGRSSRIEMGGRARHLLSDLETRCFTELQWNVAVVEIEEQYALPLLRTQQIAEELGIRHPMQPGTKNPAIMSTDFLFSHTIAGRTTLHARAVKPSSAFDLRKPQVARALRRNVEKLEIERRYWAAQGVDWRLVTDQDLDRIRAANIRLFLSSSALDPHEGQQFWEEALDLVAARLRAGSDRPLSYLARVAEDEGELLQKHFIACVRHMCATRVLTFDLKTEFSPTLRACDFTFAEAR